MSREPIEHAVVTLHANGWGQRRIAKELGIGRKLVRGIVDRVAEQRERGHSALPEPVERRGSVLDLYDEPIAELLDTHPDISAVRLHEELRKIGFPGGYTIVKEELRRLRPTPKAAFVERFETGPGEQGQQDWSPYKLDFTAEPTRKVKCFSLVLAFSRRQYIHFCDNEDLLTLERQHVAAAERFKGFPREILYDNQKAVVLRWEVHRPVYNPKFLAFATHYGFTPRALPPRRPELKGKVEQPFKYVEGNCLNARTLRDKGELDALAVEWMDETSDKHKHDTTGERPIDRFEREREALLPLPSKPYDTAEVAYRVVSEEALVRWDDVPYSVPPSALLDVVVVRVTEHEVWVYRSDLSVLARHERAPRGHREPVILPEHRPAKRAKHDVDALSARLAELGDEAARFAAGVIKKQRCRGAQLVDVLRLVERYDASDLVKALERAVRYQAYDAGVVARILEATATERPLPTTGQERARTRIQEHGEILSFSLRSLEEYGRVFDTNDEEPA